jgi:acyl carrier protein
LQIEIGGGMGLDLVELVMEVEDAFAFSIPDEDAAGLNTVGKLYDYVLARRFRGKPDACLTSMTFYRIRRTLLSVLQIPRATVRPTTELAAIIPKRRRRTWRAIQRASGLRLPFLRRPRWVVTLATLAALGFGIAMPVHLGLKPFGGGVMVAILSTAVFAYALSWLTEFLAYEFPPDVATVGQLAKATLARNYRPLVAESQKPASDAEVWDILQRIIGEQLGVRPDQLTKEMDFVKDLNAG